MWHAELSANPATGSTTDQEKAATQSSNDDDANMTDAPGWYEKSEMYWEGQQASLAGMLGGLDVLHSRDIAASKKFLNGLNVGRDRALDVGAGIGRVTRGLLVPHFNSVDLLEQSLSYAAESRRFLSDLSCDDGYVDKRIVCGMQDFRADGLVGKDGVNSSSLRGRYDVIWIQWCVIYLTDVDFIAFLKECRSALLENGMIVLKDNVARAGFVVDKDDCSVMRSGPYLKSIFQRAGLMVVKEQRQLDFPRSAFPVRMYALRPQDSVVPDGHRDGDAERLSPEAQGSANIAEQNPEQR